eukprot:Protomagalhaensia_wolfi_Nauph_80__181@NODE_10_length_5655_cov_165_650285_g7_i1_p4_GENE_NODE_10_length_5655_cov_165_650285_g7_i1NODE_10_length_5655_cov_165_650285_g7_i1_p4_ORF_typecomplete_len197_score27_63Cep57_MT_bd/PF06657_13/0_088Cep57_MT_bd/PF06657_13/83Spc29/PF17082_5/0_042Spc29/PF17082_5/9_1e02Trimer_CC/PF08954_11/0_064DUF2730/PF10805_8/2_6DUF2730/PF10805_8/5_2DUF2730/PF10805_8/2_5e03_NODE_10_length_5655_cov_165_650285_g7_i149905580
MEQQHHHPPPDDLDDRVQRLEDELQKTRLIVSSLSQRLTQMESVINGLNPPTSQRIGKLGEEGWRTATSWGDRIKSMWTTESPPMVADFPSPPPPPVDDELPDATVSLEPPAALPESDTMGTGTSKLTSTAVPDGCPKVEPAAPPSRPLKTVLTTKQTAQEAAALRLTSLDSAIKEQQQTLLSTALKYRATFHERK